MSRKVRIRFSRGGEVVVTLLEREAPQTSDWVWKHLPLTAEVLHSRWCGREINWPVKGQGSLPSENQTITTCTGALVYWRDWEGDLARAALALYYGPELLRDHRGYLPVNVFGQVDTAQWPMLIEVGERIWQYGKELVSVSRVAEGEEEVA